MGGSDYRASRGHGNCHRFLGNGFGVSGSLVSLLIYFLGNFHGSGERQGSEPLRHLVSVYYYGGYDCFRGVSRFHRKRFYG